MEGNELQPFDELTTRELQAISRRLDVQVKDLRRKQSEIQSELRHRQRTEPTIDHTLERPRGAHRLSYAMAQTAFQREAVLADSYAQEARRYGMRVGAIVAILAALLLLVLCMLAAG